MITDDDYCMNELEQALSVTGLTGDHDDQDDDVDQDDHGVDYSHNGISDDDKKLVQHCIELIKVMTSYDIIDHVILSYLFRCVPNV